MLTVTGSSGKYLIVLTAGCDICAGDFDFDTSQMKAVRQYFQESYFAFCCTVGWRKP